MKSRGLRLNPFIYSYLRLNKLLKFYLRCYLHLSGNLVKKYGHTYLRLLSDGVDDLCRWIYKLRETFDKQGQNVFDKCKYIACPA